MVHGIVVFSHEHGALRQKRLRANINCQQLVSLDIIYFSETNMVGIYTVVANIAFKFDTEVIMPRKVSVYEVIGSSKPDTLNKLEGTRSRFRTHADD